MVFLAVVLVVTGALAAFVKHDVAYAVKAISLTGSIGASTALVRLGAAGSARRHERTHPTHGRG